MAKNPVQSVLLVLICVAETALIFALPYFIIKMFNGIPPEDQTFKTAFSVMALNCYSFFSASIVPTPGGSGIIELIATFAFSNIAGATLLWVIFTWRFATYYIYIIVGVGITVFNFIRNLIRTHRAKKAATVSEADTQQQPLSNRESVPLPQSDAEEQPDRIVEVEYTPNDKSD